MTLQREEQRETQQSLQSDVEEEKSDSDVTSVAQEEVDDEEGGVFLDADCVEETESKASFISKFSFTSFSSASSA